MYYNNTALSAAYAPPPPRGGMGSWEFIYNVVAKSTMQNVTYLWTTHIARESLLNTVNENKNIILCPICGLDLVKQKLYLHIHI